MAIKLSGNNNGGTDQAMQAAANLRGHRNRMTRPKKETVSSNNSMHALAHELAACLLNMTARMQHKRLKTHQSEVSPQTSPSYAGFPEA